MSTSQDQARLVAERVARRVAESRSTVGPTASPREPEARSSGRARQPNGAPVREELSAIRNGLHDLESKLDRIESKIVHNPNQPAEPARARLIDFVSPGPPVAVSPSIDQMTSLDQRPTRTPPQSLEFVPSTHSPWVRDFNNPPDHPSLERFGI